MWRHIRHSAFLITATSFLAAPTWGLDKPIVGEDVVFEEVDGLVAYIQGGFAAPAGAIDESGSELPLATGTLPELSGMAIVVAFAIAVAAVAFVMAPRVVAATDRVNLPWLDAWMRSGIIVAFFVIFTVYIPSRIIQTETVGRLDRIVQDVIASGLWLGALLAGLAGLWWAHRDNRI